MTPEFDLDEQARNGITPEKEPGLIERQRVPENAEFPLHQWWSWITPRQLFYVRSHFPAPVIAPEEWRLAVEGEVERPLELRLADLQALPRRRQVVTLECAGNRRTEFAPCPPGVAWQDGAVSTAEWEGAALADVLALARPRPGAREVVLEGADQGTVAGARSPIRFARSLALPEALRPETLLAVRMNGAPLPLAHGAPVRVVSPGAYGMDSVKWLVRVRVQNDAFTGHFQVNDYRLFSEAGAGAPSRPIGPIRVNSLIAWPHPGVTLRPGHEVRVVGYAWSGSGAVQQVELSVDGERTWRAAPLVGPEAPSAWRLWECAWRPEESGVYDLSVRARDRSGAGQPGQAEWNAKGYGNNGRHRLSVTVSERGG